LGKLYLVRHGETVANAGGKLQGWMDAPLNERGRSQAQDAAAFFKNIHLDAVYCSTLQRARETAEILAAPHGLPVHAEQDLREFHFGAWEGLNHEEIDALDHEEWAKFFIRPKELRVRDGETFGSLQERMVKTWQRIQAQEGPDKDILLVSHGGSLRTLICYLLGLDLNYMWRLRLENLSTTCFEFWDNRPVLNFANATFYRKTSGNRTTLW
jgi:alpha-ribazole phosphatase